jgi:hypothetical protein
VGFSFLVFLFPFRDPATGWGSMDFTDFAAIFDVAAPYVPPPSESDSSNDGFLSLTTTTITIIILVVLGVIAMIFFCYSFYSRQQRKLQLQRQAAAGTQRNVSVHLEYAVPGTVAATPQGFNQGFTPNPSYTPVQGTYAAPPARRQRN